MKSLTPKEIKAELDNVHSTSASAFATVYNWVNEFKPSRTSTYNASLSGRRNPDEFLRRFVTVDETWIHYFTLENEGTVKVNQEKFELIEGSSRVDNATPSVKTLTASYAISNLIMKNSKPFCEGEFVKECIIAAVESFGNSLTLEEAASIPLSDKTVKSRIDDIASSLENKLKSSLASCSFFSLCLDESTDNRHMSQLSIFARIMQNDFLHVEELLDFVSLHDTTTGIDIFEAVNQTFQKFGILKLCTAMQMVAKILSVINDALNIFNFLHMRLQFTLEVNTDGKLSFLDTMLVIDFIN
ncbi:SCND3 protein, partial [Pseudoatta argentina]